MTTRSVDGYTGVEPFPRTADLPWTAGRRLQVVLTGLMVGVPFAGLAMAVSLSWGHGIGLTDVLLATAFYLFTAFGITVGFHRLITHRSFTARPWLRVTLAVAGSMAFEGNVISWVAVHRRHHAFTDRPGDPHSPYIYGTSLRGRLRGLAHAHLGWMFRNDPTPAERYAPDLLSDRAMVRVSKAFPALCVVSLVLPFLLGWAIGGTLYAATTAFLWAGLVRILLLQHTTWSINSLCHMVGKRPHPTREFDRSTDLWPLSLLSLGESWHNGHHSKPTSARHGLNPHQIDPSAGLIRIFERLGWATNVHWPDHRRSDGGHPRPRRIPGPPPAGLARSQGSPTASHRRA